MSKPDKKPEKPYSKPTLTVYGTVRQLTGVVGHHMALDGGSIVNMTHTSL
ncbi:MAG TPA: lasso RiPP family leader peptide-containing protein [Methylomirabilota bacterium]|nr:lasso RiPP family leader peptide-containing protein [Methylomirabilota bacterium]